MGRKRNKGTIISGERRQAPPAPDPSPLPLGTSGTGGNLVPFGVEECPECKRQPESVEHRLVIELCGHTRCLRCLIKTTPCTQCQSQRAENSPQSVDNPENHKRIRIASQGKVPQNENVPSCSKDVSVLRSDGSTTTPATSEFGDTNDGQTPSHFSLPKTGRPRHRNQHTNRSSPPAETETSPTSASTHRPTPMQVPFHLPMNGVLNPKAPSYYRRPPPNATYDRRRRHPLIATKHKRPVSENGVESSLLPSGSSRGEEKKRKKQSPVVIPQITVISATQEPHPPPIPATYEPPPPPPAIATDDPGPVTQTGVESGVTFQIQTSIPSSSSGGEEKKKKKRSPVVIHPHITVISGQPTMFQCNVCTKKFKTRANIKYHEFCKNGTKPFKCEQCGQGFIAKSHYEYHLRTHTGERPYLCPKCGKGFNQRGKVTRHMRSHTGVKPFTCGECGRGFANPQALKSHNLIHTGERPYACKYCNKRFTGMTNLKKHIITHTGEKPYTCIHCNKSFGVKWTLDNHLRTHSSERPYACEQCTLAFSNSKDLRRHLVIHSGIRAFKCWICETTFRRKDNLDRHIKNTHNQPKEVAKNLANGAAAEYLAMNSISNSAVAVPVSKVNSAVISSVIKTAQLGAPKNPGASQKTSAVKSKPKKPTRKRIKKPTQPALLVVLIQPIIREPISTTTEEVIITAQLYNRCILPESEDPFLDFLSIAEVDQNSQTPSEDGRQVLSKSRNLAASDCGILFDKEPENIIVDCCDPQAQGHFNQAPSISDEKENSIVADLSRSSTISDGKETQVIAKLKQTSPISDEKEGPNVADLSPASSISDDKETPIIADLRASLISDDKETEEISDLTQDSPITNDKEPEEIEENVSDSEKPQVNEDSNQGSPIWYNKGPKNIPDIFESSLSNEKEPEEVADFKQDSPFSNEKEHTEIADCELSFSQHNWVEDNEYCNQTLPISHKEPEEIAGCKLVASAYKGAQVIADYNPNQASPASDDRELGEEEHEKAFFKENETQTSFSKSDESIPENSKILIGRARPIFPEPCSSGENVQFYYQQTPEETYNGNTYYSSQIAIDRPYSNNEAENCNVNIVYASATAQEERNDDENGPPMKIRLLHADALGVRRSESYEQQQLFYSATRPNQVIEDYSSSAVSLALPAVIHPPGSHAAPPHFTIHEYGIDAQVAQQGPISQMPSEYLVHATYDDGFAHAQQVSTEQSYLINREEEISGSLPDVEYYTDYTDYWNSCIPGETPIIYASHHYQEDQHQESYYSEQADHGYYPQPEVPTPYEHIAAADGSQQNALRSSQQLHTSPVLAPHSQSNSDFNLCSELSREEMSRYESTIDAAIAIAIVGEKARMETCTLELEKGIQNIRMVEEDRPTEARANKSYYHSYS